MHHLPGSRPWQSRLQRHVAAEPMCTGVAVSGTDVLHTETELHISYLPLKAPASSDAEDVDWC